MSNEIFEQILADHKELSSLPQTLVEVLRVVRDETSSPNELATTLSRDPALTAKVLRAANSPFYGTGRDIGSIPQAVMILGTRSVTALALSASIYDMTGKWGSTVDRQRFWRHSLDVGVTARMIAEASGYRYPDEALVAGLLHDIGILVLDGSFPEKYNRIFKHSESGDPLSELEENTWGTNHARVGQFLFEQWNLPSAICQAVGQHHNIFVLDAPEEEFHLSQIVSLANMGSRFSIVHRRFGTAPDLDQRSIVRTNLKLSPERLAEIEQAGADQMLREAEFIDIDIGSAEDILQEANRLLYSQFATVERLLAENSQMQEEIAQARLRKAALEALRAITATFNHYVNNAAGTILGRAQLVEAEVDRGGIIDTGDTVVPAMQKIMSGVETIRLVMQELSNLSSFETTTYLNDTYIIKIEEKIKRRLEKLKQPAETAQ